MTPENLHPASTGQERSNWTLRLSKWEDAAFLPAIERDAGQLFAGDDELATLAAEPEVISVQEHRAYIARGRCLVALVEGAITGFLTAEPAGRALHIVEMSVATAHQRCGIGEGLVRAALIDAENSGFNALTLTTFADIAWNGPFYERLGFTKVEDLEAHPRLANILQREIEDGLPAERRIAMIRFLG